MRNFQDTFETCKWSFINAFSISMTVPLIRISNELQAHGNNHKTQLRCSTITEIAQRYNAMFWYIWFATSKAHCVKCVQIRSFFWSVFSRIRSEYGKIRTRKNSVFGHFSRSGGTWFLAYTLYTSWFTCCRTTYELCYSESRKYQKNTKVGWRYSLVLSFPSRNKTLVIAAKMYVYIEAF